MPFKGYTVDGIGELMKLFHAVDLSLTIGLCLSAVTAFAQQAPVNLGSTSTFAALAGTTVTVTGGGAITGNIGIFPSLAFVAGTPAVTVNGTVYAGGPVAAQAQADLTIAYNDAASRSVAPITVAGNIGGQTLAPGLYKSTSSLAISSGDLTLDAKGNPNAVWIFQIASTLTTTSGRQVILAGGASAVNIFWQVGSSATLGTASVFQGNILAAASISMLTGSTISGRALAMSGAVTIDTGGGSSVTLPVAATVPTVTFTAPANGATNVFLANTLAATFSTAMNPATLTVSTFTVMQGALPVSGVVTYAGTTATFTPYGSLVSNTQYTATINAGARDLAGNSLAANYSWSFTTGSSTNDKPPTVISTVPNSAATAVAIGNKLSATFSEVMNPATLSASSFTLLRGTTPVSGVVTYAGTTATFAPTATLVAGAVYTATIGIGARDLTGNALAANYIWSFTTGANLDLTQPAVIATLPANGALGVQPGSTLTASFSKPMDPLTITTATFTLQQGATPIPGTVTYSGNTATFVPLRLTGSNTATTATITNGARDLAGNPLAGNFVWSFTTQPVADPNPPSVVSTTPLGGAQGVSVGNNITVTFSKAMNPATINTLTFLVKRGLTPIAGTVTYNGAAATFAPFGALAPSSAYTVSISNGATDLAGNVLESNYFWGFTTQAVVDTIPPTVTSTNPLGGAQGVTAVNSITASFSKPMNPATINTLTFTVSQGSTPIAGVVTYSGITATFNPTSDLTAGTEYTASISKGVTDLSGIPLTNNYYWGFTTHALFPAPSVINLGGTVNAASYVAPVAPGSIASVFGTNLATGQESSQVVTSLPKTLAQSSFTIGGASAPLFFAAPSQVSLQIPWELAGQTQTAIVATVNGSLSNSQSVPLAMFAPGIFAMNLMGYGQGAVLIATTAQLAAAGTAAPRGGYISIFCTGLGPVTNQPGTGMAAPSDPLAFTTATPTVTIGGVPALVTFSGLAPGFVGLYQVNIQVPSGVNPGDAVTVIVSVGTATSNMVTIAVQ